MRRSIITLLLLGLVAGATGPAGAEPQPPRQVKLVGVLPPRHLDGTCQALFNPDKATRHESRHIARAIEATLATFPDVTPVSSSALRKRIASRGAYGDRLVVGRERYLLGKEFYNDLRQKEAEAQLRKAVEILDAIFYDVVEPEAFSDILLLLGITQTEEEDAGAAHQAFKRALALHPRTRFARGYHPRPVETALTVACEDLQRSLEKEIPFGSLERTHKFLQRARIDTLIYPVIIRVDGTPTLRLIAYERNNRVMPFSHTIPLTTPEADSEAISRALSRWAACTPFRNVPQRVEEKNAWIFTAGYQHLAYLQYPTRTTLYAMGFSFDGGRFLKPNLALVVKAQFMSSLPDRFGDLLDGFTSARIIVGTAFSLSGAWWRIFITPGAEFHYLGSFSVTRDPNCKHFVRDSAGWSQCDQSAIKSFPVDFLAGINLYVGSQFFLSDDVFLGVGSSVSTYFAPFDRSFEMNFPVAVEAGGGIAF